MPLLKMPSTLTLHNAPVAMPAGAAGFIVGMFLALMPVRWANSDLAIRGQAHSSPPGVERFKPTGLGYSPIVAGEPTLQPRRVPRLLAIYLVDHHAGSAAGLEHARHLLSRSSEDAAGDVSRLVEEIVYDRVQLERLMRALGVRRNPVKVALARAGAILARLKPNGRVGSSPALSRLIEFETLLLGITGKQALWQALRQTPSVNGPGSLDFDELATRAADQAARVESLRLEAAHAALRNASANFPASA